MPEVRPGGLVSEVGRSATTTTDHGRVMPMVRRIHQWSVAGTGIHVQAQRSGR